MSTQRVPCNDREHKARELAADPNAIYKVTPALYLVHSQTHTSRYYEVYAIESGWTCTCPDHRKTAQPCKHILALVTVLAAQDDLARWTTRRGWTHEQTIDRIENRMGAGDLDDREMLMLKVYRNAAELPHVAFALRYYWPDHHPETLLDAVYGNYQPEPNTVDVRTPAQWSTWRPIDGPIESIRDYIEEQAITHGPIYISESRQHGRWEGRFNLIMLTAQAA
jgi:hypothetical protein